MRAAHMFLSRPSHRRRRILAASRRQMSGVRHGFSGPVVMAAAARAGRAGTGGGQGGKPGPRHPARPAPVELDGGRADRGDGRHRLVFRPGQLRRPAARRGGRFPVPGSELPSALYHRAGSYLRRLRCHHHGAGAVLRHRRERDTPGSGLRAFRRWAGRLGMWSRVDAGTAVAVAQRSALGTDARVALWPPDGLAVALGAVDAELERLDRQASRFRGDSEISRIRRSQYRAHRVSPGLADAVRVALAAARWTCGLVDPTVGGALSALGYDRDFASIDTGPGPAGQLPVPGPVPG